MFSLAFRTAKIGIAVGGNFLDEDNGRRMSARTSDGGDTWVRGGNLDGYRSGVSWVPHSQSAIAVGPSGTEISDDGGRAWTTIGGTGFHSVQCVGNLEPVCWASGPEGMVGLLVGLPEG